MSDERELAQEIAKRAEAVVIAGRELERALARFRCLGGDGVLVLDTTVGTLHVRPSDRLTTSFHLRVSGPGAEPPPGLRWAPAPGAEGE